MDQPARSKTLTSAAPACAWSGWLLAVAAGGHLNRSSCVIRAGIQSAATEPDNNVYCGDVHVHTGWSFDALTNGSKTATYTDAIGAAQLAAGWTDPDFNPGQGAGDHPGTRLEFANLVHAGETMKTLLNEPLPHSCCRGLRSWSPTT